MSKRTDGGKGLRVQCKITIIRSSYAFLINNMHFFSFNVQTIITTADNDCNNNNDGNNDDSLTCMLYIFGISEYLIFFSGVDQDDNTYLVPCRNNVYIE